MVLADPNLAGIHFTGSTRVFQQLWGTVGTNIALVPVLPAAGRRDRRQGLRRSPTRRPTWTCCAPRWSAARSSTPGRSARRRPGPTCRRRSGRRCATSLVAETEALTVGDVEDFANFTSAVIDDRSFGRLKAAIDRAQATDSIEVLAGGTYDDAERLLRPADAAAGHRPGRRDLLQRVLRADPVDPRLRRRGRRGLHRRAVRGRHGVAVRADRLDHRPRPAARSPPRRTRCASPPATSTSTTSRPVPSSASSRSAGPGPRGPTTRPARRRT